MIVKSLLLTTGLLASAAAPAQMVVDAYESGDLIHLPRPYQLTAVEKVSITRAGAWSAGGGGDRDADECNAFAPREADVEAFFAHAERISRLAYSRDLEQSNCYAEGEVRFANGDSGRWRLSPFRGGTLLLQDGRMIYLHCRRCQASLFDEPDDPAADD